MATKNAAAKAAPKAKNDKVVVGCHVSPALHRRLERYVKGTVPKVSKAAVLRAAIERYLDANE